MEKFYLRIFLATLVLSCSPSPQELAKKAIALRLNGRYEEAKKLLEKALAKEPSAEIYKELGNYYLLAQEDLDEAEKNYLMALKLDPRYLNAIHNLGLVYIKRYEKSQDSIGKGDNEYLEKARQYLKEALTINPNFALSWQELARYNFYLKNYDQSIENIEKSLSLDPKSARAFLIAGQIYLKGKKNLAMAKNYFEQAYALDRKMSEAIFYLYVVNKRQKNLEDANFYYQEYAKLLAKENLPQEEISKALQELEEAAFNISINIEEPKNR